MGSLSLLVCDWRGLVSSLCGASKPAHKGKEREVSLLWVWWRAEELEAHNQPNQFTHSAASFDLFDYLLSISLPFQQSNQTNFTFRLFDGAERKFIPTSLRASCFMNFFLFCLRWPLVFFVGWLPMALCAHNPPPNKFSRPTPTKSKENSFCIRLGPQCPPPSNSIISSH